LVKDAEKQLVHEIKASEDLFSADNKKSTKRMRRNYSQAILILLIFLYYIKIINFDIIKVQFLNIC